MAKPEAAVADAPGTDIADVRTVTVPTDGARVRADRVAAPS